MSEFSTFHILKSITRQKMSSVRHHWTNAEDVFLKMYSFTRSKTVKAMGYYPYYPGIESFNATEVTIDGEKKIMLGSNNYLGLTHHPEVIEAGINALKKYGSGVTGSRLLNGNLNIHTELEEKIARFVGKEKALVFSTGYGVNQGVLSSTLSDSDLLFSDALNHASIVDGVSKSRCRVVMYKHNDMTDLEQNLTVYERYSGKMIVSDGVFSMEGDIVNLPELVRIAKQYNCRTMIDEAHSIGIFGKNGEGLCGHFGVSGEVDLIMGTFSKSLGSIGGFIASEEPVIEYFKHHTRTMIFTAALPPVNVATVSKALDILMTDTQRRENVLSNALYMKQNLGSMGFDIGNSHTPVIPVIIGDDFKTFRVWKDLMIRGVYTNPIVSPAVPRHRALLRTSYMATHTKDQLDLCLHAFREVGKKFHLIE